MSKDAENLLDLLARANAAYDALTPEEKWKHRREQLISWVFGEMKLRGHEMPRYQIEHAVDEMIREGEVTLDGRKPVGPTIWERLRTDKELP